MYERNLCLYVFNQNEIQFLDIWCPAPTSSFPRFFALSPTPGLFPGGKPFPRRFRIISNFLQRVWIGFRTISDFPRRIRIRSTFLRRVWIGIRTMSDFPRRIRPYHSTRYRPFLDRFSDVPASMFTFRKKSLVLIVRNEHRFLHHRNIVRRCGATTRIRVTRDV